MVHRFLFYSFFGTLSISIIEIFFFCFGLCLFLFHLNTHFLFDLFSSANQYRYSMWSIFDIQYNICLWMALHGNRTLMQNDIKSINQKNCVTYFSGKNISFFCSYCLNHSWNKKCNIFVLKNQCGFKFFCFFLNDANHGWIDGCGCREWTDVKY